MTGLTIGRFVAVVLGLMLLSPGVVLLLNAIEPLGGDTVLIVLVLLESSAIIAVIWGLKSLSLTALVATLVASPWTLYFASDTGPWAYLIAGPEYLLLLVLGWIGLRKEQRPLLRWTGALAPTLLVVYAALAPLVRS